MSALLPSLLATVSFCELLGTYSVKSSGPVERLYDDEGHDDLEIVDHVLLPDVHHQGLVLVGGLCAEEIQLAARLGNRNAEDR